MLPKIWYIATIARAEWYGICIFASGRKILEDPNQAIVHAISDISAATSSVPMYCKTLLAILVVF
jgi:hypothetical protein